MDFSLKKSWGAAREDCLSRGADLVSIHNQDEENFLSIYTKGTSKGIGLKHDPTDGGVCVCVWGGGAVSGGLGKRKF